MNLRVNGRRSFINRLTVENEKLSERVIRDVEVKKLDGEKANC